MTKKLEEILQIDIKKEKVELPETDNLVSAPVINLQEKLEEFDKIAAALPKVKGLGEMADAELDALASKAEQAYDDLMDLGMNVEARFSGHILATAGTLLGHAITAKQAKLDKKLRMVDLQLKKARLDLQIEQANKKTDGDKIVDAEDGQGIVLDRNELLNQLLNKKSQ